MSTPSLPSVLTTMRVLAGTGTKIGSIPNIVPPPVALRSASATTLITVSPNVGPVAKVTFTPDVHENVRALVGEVKAASESQASNTILVDSRPQKRYDDGHIPGAAHVFWEETVANPKKPVFLSPEQLRALFSSRGITPGHKLVTYCEVGMQASHYLMYEEEV